MNSALTPERRALAARLLAFETDDPQVERLVQWLAQATRMRLFGPAELRQAMHVLDTAGGCGWNALTFDVEGDEVEVTYVRDVMRVPVERLRAVFEALADDPPPTDAPDLVTRLGAYAQAVASGDAAAAEDARERIEQAASDPATRAAWADAAARIITSVSAAPGGIAVFGEALDRWAAGDSEAGRVLDDIVRRWESEFGAQARSNQADAMLRRRVRGSIRDAIMGRGFVRRSGSTDGDGGS